jgi:Fe-S-cluster-containing hydrogenase component 2
MRRLLISNYDVCTGCRICELTCSFEKEQGYNPRFARLRVEASADGLWNDIVVCAQCENPACLRVCPTDAIVRDAEQGVVLVKAELCTGCGLCVQYCHRQTIMRYAKADGGKAYKCDLCGGRVPCVEACPTGALHCVTLEEKVVTYLS